LALSRRIKELWIFGPLASDQDSTRQQAGDLERDVLQVAKLVNGLEESTMNELATKYGGTWKDKPKEAGQGRGQV